MGDSYILCTLYGLCTQNTNMVWYSSIGILAKELYCLNFIYFYTKMLTRKVDFFCTGENNQKCTVSRRFILVLNFSHHLEKTEIFLSFSIYFDLISVQIDIKYGKIRQLS